MKRKYTGASACCCGLEDCNVIENFDGYKNFYKSFKEEGVVWQPIKESQQVWNEHTEQWETKEVLTDCKATVEDECKITLIDKKALYKEDNIGIHLINVPQALSFEEEIDTEATEEGPPFINTRLWIEHKLTFSGHTFCFIQEGYFRRDRPEGSADDINNYSCISINYVTFDDKKVYEYSDCFQLMPGSALDEAAIIRKDGKSYFYAGSHLLEVVPGGKKATLSYELTIAIKNIKPLEIRYQNFKIWKPDKWWLFPERFIPYYTPSELKRLSPRDAQILKKLKYYGNKEKQGCPYPLRYPRLDIDPRVYCEDVAFNIYNLPKYTINCNPTVTVDLKQLAKERHVLTWDHVPAYTESNPNPVWHNYWATVSTESRSQGYYAQSFSPRRVTNYTGDTVVIDSLNTSINPPEVQSTLYKFEPSYADTALAWFIGDKVIFAPNICVTVGAGERIIFEDIIHTVDDPSVDVGLPFSQYFFTDIRILKKPDKGTVSLIEKFDFNSIAYDAPKDTTGCVDIEYELTSVFGLKSKGNLSIYIVDKDDPYYYKNKDNPDGVFDTARNAYVIDFWSHRGDDSLDTYHDDIILNRVSILITSLSANSKQFKLGRIAPGNIKGDDYSWLASSRSFGFRLRLDLYAGVHARVMKLDKIKKLKYVYVPGMSSTVCVNRLGIYCKLRDKIVSELEGSIFTLEDAFDSILRMDTEQFSLDTGVSIDDLNQLSDFINILWTNYQLVHSTDERPTAEQIKEWLSEVNKYSFALDLGCQPECWYTRPMSLTTDTAYNEIEGELTTVEFDLNVLKKIYVQSTPYANHVIGKFKHNIKNPFEDGSKKDLKELTVTLESKGALLVWGRNDWEHGENYSHLKYISSIETSEHTIAFSTISWRSGIPNAFNDFYLSDDTNVPRLNTSLDSKDFNVVNVRLDISSQTICPNLTGAYFLWHDIAGENDCVENDTACLSNYLGISIDMNGIILTGNDSTVVDSYNLIKGPVYELGTQCVSVPGSDTCDLEQAVSMYTLKNVEKEYYD